MADLICFDVKSARNEISQGAKGRSQMKFGNGGAYASRTIIFSPCFGRSVTVGFRPGSCPGRASNRQRRAITARRIAPSVQAKASPMQTRAPPPKGKEANLG